MTLEEFVFNVPLYQKIDVEDGYTDIIELLKRGDEERPIHVDGYNPIRRKESTFILIRGLGDVDGCYYDSHSDEYIYPDEVVFINSYYETGGVKKLCFKCQRYGDEINIFVFNDIEKSIIIKVGQHPSVADIHIGQVKQYDKVLEKPILKEFTRAIGLAANGVGIGSFVYLRRIFEKLIYEAFNEANKGGNIGVEQFEKQRMDEKIKSLHDFLPPFIVEHSSIYGILSKGIHELLEKECLDYFDTMRVSIEMILDQRIEIRERQKKEEVVKKEIDAITENLKNRYGTR